MHDPDLAGLRAGFTDPPPEARPTPLYWWSGADLDPERLRWQLDRLADRGVGGTVVGYAHLPDVRLDHGDPAPLSAPWWRLFRDFVAASADRGMTVGFQDYGIIGGILVRAGERTADLGGGSLQHDLRIVRGPLEQGAPEPAERVLTRRAFEVDGSRELSLTAGGTLPEGAWMLSTVTVEPGRIGPWPSAFDPLHPASGAAVIDLFYERFRTELGELFGTAFTTFFQDELDLGVVVPMWDGQVGERLAAAGFDPERWIHALWHDLGPDTLRVRALYRDLVVELLEEHYFRPIWEWHERHGSMLVMDQLSRGDLRLGRHHYADYLQTMRWYQGPGNDDPDVTAPRNIAAFRVSASLAHLHDRPRVMNEALHSSGWGVTPAEVVGALNVGFACGVNQVMLHGLDYTTESGWWEWASPDFHFRQPWWTHSAPLWRYLARVSQLMRSGDPVADVAVIDPTQELDLGVDSAAPEYARELLERLARDGIGTELVPQAGLREATVALDDGVPVLRVHAAAYRAVVLPAVSMIRDDTAAALEDFALAGGVVIAAGGLPGGTELGSLSPAAIGSWVVAPRAPESLAAELRRRVPVQVQTAQRDVLIAHRRTADADLYLVVNAGEAEAELELALLGGGALERWDPWTGTMRPHPGETDAAADAGPARLRTRLRLAPTESAVLVRRHDAAPDPGDGGPALAPEPLVLDGDWAMTAGPGELDNRYADFAADGHPLALSSVHLDAAAGPEGPWRPAVAGHEARFAVLGPVAPGDVAELDRTLPGATRSWPPALPTPEGLAWRPYALSFDEGVADDPYLRDRDTGPHGLKGVPAEFLDPHCLDPAAPAGSAYYFLSSVESSGGQDTVTSLGRTRFRVWVGGRASFEMATERAAAFFPPWGLRDMSADPVTVTAELAPGRTAVLVKVVVSEQQPTRVAVVVGGRPPEHPVRARSPWWQGEHPARRFRLDRGEGVSVDLVRATAPVGARGASVDAGTRIRSARWGGLPAEVRTAPDGRVEFGRPPSAPACAELLLEVEVPARLLPDAGVGGLESPIRWAVATESTAPADWTALGLRDHSGVVVYERDVAVPEGAADATLRLSGLVGSAAVSVDDRRAGVILADYQRLELGGLTPGRHRLRIEAANTLQNLYSRLPSPYTAMQPAGGGFREAVIEFGERR